MSFIIRKATKNDAQAILNLIIELAVFEKEPDAVEITVEDIIRDGFGKHPKFNVLVAQENEKIIGTALFYERYSTWKGRVIHLEDLIVTQTKRKIGVGKALYTEVLQYAYDLKCKRVVWDVLDWNTNAIDFYESTGAVVMNDWRVVHMREQELKNFIEQ